MSDLTETETIAATAEEPAEENPTQVSDGHEADDATEDSAPSSDGDLAADGADGGVDDGADDGADGGEGSSDPQASRTEVLEQEGDIAADYLEELLEIADLDGDIDLDVEGDRATVSIVGANLPQLVGPDGEVLEALQELTRLAVYRETGERSRLMLDVSGHRADRRSTLERRADEIVAQVKESGERAELEPMSPFERKVVHDVVAAAGLRSESEGVEPQRFVVILPAE